MSNSKAEESDAHKQPKRKDGEENRKSSEDEDFESDHEQEQEHLRQALRISNGPDLSFSYKYIYIKYNTHASKYLLRIHLERLLGSSVQNCQQKREYSEAT